MVDVRGATKTLLKPCEEDFKKASEMVLLLLRK